MFSLPRGVGVLCCVLFLAGLQMAAAAKCPTPMDIGILVDTSGGLSESDVSELNDFLNKFASLFHLAPHSSHMSVMTASGNITHIALRFLIEGNNRKGIKNHFHKLQTEAGEWNLDKALSVAAADQFSFGGGARHFLPLVLVVIATGKERAGSFERFAQAASKLHEMRVQVYAIGIGGRTSDDVLQTLVDDQQGRVVKMDNFAELSAAAKSIETTICGQNHASKTICNVPVDIGFILDSSASVGVEGYQKMKNFMMGVSLSMGFKPGFTHIGLVLYSETAELAFNFKEFGNTRKLFRAIKDMKHHKGRTRIDLGLQVAHDQLFTLAGGMREGVAQIAILLTDGIQTTNNVRNYNPPEHVAQLLKDREITIFVVSIGEDINKEQLQQIVGENGQVVPANTFDELDNAASKIALLTCRKAVDAVINFTKPVYNFGESRNAVVEVRVEEGEVTTPVTVTVYTSFGTASSEDFTETITNVTFQPGEVGPKPVEIPVNDDGIVEVTESFVAALDSSSPVLLGDPVTVNILDNDEATIGFTEGVYDVREDEKPVVQVSVTSGEIAVPVMVRVETRPSTATNDDFVPVSVDVSFKPGESGPKLIPIDVTDDKLVEATEKFEVYFSYSSLSGVKLGKPSTINILDNDEALVEFTKSSYEAPEGDSPGVTAQLTSGELGAPVTVRIGSRPGTATQVDYVQTTQEITFPAGETGPIPIDIDLVDDSSLEQKEQFTLVFVSSSIPGVKLGKPATVDILDNDEAVIGFVARSYDIPENENAIVEVKLISGKLEAPVTVSFSTSPSSAGTSDYVPKTQDITFQPGESDPKSVEIEIIDDDLIEPTENFTVQLTSTSPGVTLGAPATVNILDNDKAVISFTKLVYDVPEDTNAIVDVEVTSGTLVKPVTVRVATGPLTAGDGDFKSMSKEVTFTPEDTGPRSVQIDIVDDDIVERTENFSVTFSLWSPGVTPGKPATVNILDNDEVLVSFTKGTYDIPENENAVVEVSVSSEKLDKPISVSVSAIPAAAGAEDFVPKTQVLTFGPGDTGPKTATFDVVDDDSVEPKEDFNVKLDSTSPGVTLGEPAKVNILDNDEVTIRFTKREYDIPEDEDAVVVIELGSGKLATPVTVSVSTSPGSASKDDDYKPKTQDVTFAPDDTDPKSVTVDVVDDDSVELKENFNVELTSTSPGVKLGEPAKVNILDNDEVVIGFTQQEYDVPEDTNAVLEISITSGKLEKPVTVSVSTSPGLAFKDDDYKPKTQDVTFALDDTDPKSVTVDVVDDDSVEPKENFNVELTSTSPGVKLGEPAKVNILDNDEVVIGFTQQEYDVPEDTNAVLEISITSGKLEKPVTVSVSTSPGSASKDDDYKPKTQDVTFAPDDTDPKSVTVDVVDDDSVEPKENFNVELTSTSPGVKLGEPAKVNILDNDEVVIGFTQQEYDVPEDTNAVVEISITSGKLEKPVTVSVSTSPGLAFKDDDYKPKTQDVTFAPDDTDPKSVTVDVVDDDSVEPKENFNVELTSTSPGVKLGEPAKVNILDNDEVVIGFTQQEYDVPEDTNAVLEISITSGKLEKPVTVSVSTSPGSASKDDDYKPKTQDVTFSPDDTDPKSVTVDVVDDDSVEPKENFNVELTSTSPGVKLGEPAKVNILDNDEIVIGFTQQEYDVPEDTNAVLGISITSGKLEKPVTVSVSTSPGSASKDDDYKPKTQDVTFAPDDTDPKSVTVDVVDDDSVEPKENFNVELTSTSPGVKLGEPAKVNILDNDEVVIGFTQQEYDVPEDTNAVLEISITSGKLEKPVTVSVSTSPGSASEDDDYKPKTQDVTFAPDDTDPKSVTVDVVDDDSVEPKEDFNVELTSTSPGVKLGEPAKVNILDNDEVIIGFTQQEYDVPEDTNAVLEISITSGKLEKPVTVSVSTSPGSASKDDDYKPKTQDVTFAPDDTDPKSVTVDVVDDDSVEPKENFNVELTSTSPGVKLGEPAKVNILDNDEVVIGFTQQEYDVPEDTNAVLEISITSGKLEKPVTVSVSTSPGSASEDDDYKPKTQDVTFAPDDTDPKSVTVDVVDDDSVEPKEDFNVELTSTSPGVKLGEPAKVNILDNDEVVIGFTQQEYDVPEDTNAVLEISITSGKLEKPVTVSVSTSPGSASEDDDYKPKTQDVTFAPDDTDPKSVTLDVVDDDSVEPKENFNVELTSTSPGVKLGEPAKVNILDNDDVVIGFTQQEYDVPEDTNAVLEISVTSGKLEKPVTVSVSTSPGSASKDDDYKPKTQDVTFAPDDTDPKSVTVDVVDDENVEPKENFNVELTSTSPGVTLGEPAKVNILDNDEASIGFTKRFYDTMENETAVVEIKVTSGSIDMPVTVSVSTMPSTAKYDDFIPKAQDIVFNPGEKGPKRIEIEPVDDDSVEMTEQFKVLLTSSSVPAVKLGKPASVNIKDNDEVMVMFTKPNYYADENSTKAVIQVYIAEGKLARPITIRVEGGPTDFVPKFKEVTFKPGDAGPKDIVYNLVDDKVIEGTESFPVSLNTNVPGVNVGEPSKVNIIDDDVLRVGFVETVYVVLEDGKPAIKVQVTSGKVSKPMTIEFSTSPLTAGDGDFVPKVTEVTFSPGESDTKTVEIEVIDDDEVEPTESFKITLKAISPAVEIDEPASATVNIIDNDVPKICGTEKDDCHKFATCKDIGPGSYQCTCNDGYTGDGTITCKASTCSIDIGFLVDATGSMRNCNFEIEKDFVKEIAGYFGISPGASRTSLIVYSNNAVLVKKFNSSTTLDNFKNQVDDLQFQGGRPDMDKALYLAASSMFSKENGMRSLDIPKVLIVLNDGTLSKISPAKAKEIASKLQENEVRLVVVGVGEADREHLSQLVALPDHLIAVPQFKDAKQSLADLSKKICPSDVEDDKYMVHAPSKEDSSTRNSHINKLKDNDCKIVRKTIDLNIGGCFSSEPVDIGVCNGGCSSNRFVKQDTVYEAACLCCQPKSKVKKTVSLKCSMNTTQPFDIMEAETCGCNPC